METPVESSSQKNRKRTRRGKKKKKIAVQDESMTDTLITPGEHLRPAAPQFAPASGTIPTFDYGITTADPAAAWTLFQTLSIHHDSISDIREAVGLPRLQDLPYRLGSGPRASLPPWSFFPPAPSTTDAPALDPVTSSSPVDPAEMLTAASRLDMPPPSSVPQDAALAALYHAAVAEFDPDMDDLLDEP